MFLDYIKTICSQNKDSVANEVEFRFGSFDVLKNSFNTGCSVKEFRDITKDFIKGYSKNPTHSYFLNVSTGEERLRLSSVTFQGLSEYINSGIITNSMNYNIIKKHKIITDNTQNEYKFRLNLAHEEELSDASLIKFRYNNSIKTFRLAQRWSYAVIPGITVDLTCIKQCTGKTFKEGVPKMTPEKYEVEIDISDISIMEKEANILDIYLTRIVLILNGYIKIQKQSILADFWRSYSHKYDPRLFAQNVPLTNKILDKTTKEDLVVVDKADGERYLMFINEEGVSVLISGKEKVLWTDITAPELSNSLFDGELVLNESGSQMEYHIFDVLWYLGKDVRELPFYNEEDLSIYSDMALEETPETKIKLTNKIYLKQYVWYSKGNANSKISLKNKPRLNEINEFSSDGKRTIKYVERKEIVAPAFYAHRYSIIISAINPDILKTPNFLITPKYFYPLRMLVTLNKYDIIGIDEEKQKLSKGKFYELDGLIVQNKNGVYPKQIKAGVNPQWNDSYKWKFPISVTIDFEIVFKTKLVDEIVCLLRGGAYDIQQNFKIIDSKIRTISGDVICNNNIVEFGRDDKGIWIPYRIRDDKTKPNSITTIMTTIELMDDPVAITSLVI